MPMHKRVIFWFKRDLRVYDNTGLYHAVKESREVIPVFILEPGILKRLNPDGQRLGLLLDALKKLEADLKALGSYLLVLKGDAREIFPRICSQQGIDAVYLNKAYSSYGAKRDECVRDFCFKNDIKFCGFEDTFLVSPERLEARKVFTPFYRLWLEAYKADGLLRLKKVVSPPIKRDSLEKIISELDFARNKHWAIDYPEKRLKEFDFGRYEKTRNFPYMDGTSRLSPYLRFGIISIREVYHAASDFRGDTNTFISELAWREFWYHIMHHFSETRDLEFQEKRRNIEWWNNEKWYEAWKDGRTGYPIVDAGMRQLREEGWMHNRVRMIVASFLTKDLLVDWRWGDRHFFHYLVDYDENVDVGNWQWAASVGPDPKPLRIFNPVLQSKKFDPDCRYIKKYIPELKNEEPERIHDPLKNDLPYHEPIVDHYEMSRRAKEAYFKAEQK